MNPEVSERNLTPTSTAAGSGSSGPVNEPSQIEQGQVLGMTETTRASPGCSRLPLSSTARPGLSVLPVLPGVQL